MLKVKIDQGGDYLDYLSPYIIHVLRTCRPEIVNDATVAALLAKECGLQIPNRTVQVVLQRFVRRGLLTKANHVYTVVGPLPADDLASQRTHAEHQIADVVDRLRDYAQRTADRVLTENEALECLVLFLSHFSVTCLSQYLRGTTLPDPTTHNSWQLALARQFVNHIESDSRLFAEFMTLVQGHMLANALLCPDLEAVSDSYERVTFFLDTKLLLRLLGLEGEQEQRAMTELLGLLRQLRGAVVCFTHTRDEASHVIRGAANWLDRHDARGSVVTEARKAGRSKADLILIAESLTDRLKELGVSVQQKPPYEKATHRYEIDEAVFAEVLDQEITYYNSRAADHDVQSVRSIFILRKGETPESLEKCRAVLVTSNKGFADAAYEYGRKYESQGKVSTVITDLALGNVAWLKAPQQAPQLPQREVLAFAYAAMRPTNDFWRRVLAEADRLQSEGRISAADHQLLRSSYAVQEDLVKLTLGDDAALTAEGITKTLRRVTDEIRQEEMRKRLHSERERDDIRKRLESQAADVEDIRKRVYARYDRQAAWEARIVGFCVFVLLCGGVALGFFHLPRRGPTSIGLRQVSARFGGCTTHVGA